eukprot:CAMPEP_0198220674 /NCGR_PEP_ID=MMETSP1445-20131203/80185_1 /TAXON_ID=36898 /ORGANISM="Pyramimonas sp., Strain CCMP2087" /LENGTH=524 /DNA_ID=CAMNT_0043898539 /DNA_START=112 /DNA_END=1682 /DNA_ORIENTATION=+
MGETKGDEENPDAVNEYLRRFNKRKQTQQEKTSTNYGLNILLGVLFSFTLAVVTLAYFSEMKYLKRTEPHAALDLHEFDEKVTTGAKTNAPTVATSDVNTLIIAPSPATRSLAGVQQFNSEFEVDGCSDNTRKEHWVAHCKALYDGKVYRRGEDGPLVALMESVKPGTHAASLLELSDGTLLYAWFSGKEGLAGVVIVVSRLAPGSDQWTHPQVISAHNGRSNQNPVLFRDPATQTIWLLHTSQEGGKGQGTAFVASLSSADGGLTWTPPEKMTGFRDSGPFVKGKLLLAENGDWLVPMYYTPDGFGAFSTHYSAMLRTSNHGTTWHQSLMSTKGQFLAQPTVVRLNKSHHLLAFFRDRKGQWIFTSLSTDEGATWPLTHTKTRLPNNNSGIQAAVLANGNIVLVFNNLQGFKRFPLSVALSEDEGKTFAYVRDIEKGGATLDPVSPALEQNRYSYPSVIGTADGRIHIGYTYRRETMKYVVIDEAWIRRGGTVGVFKGDTAPIATDETSAPAGDASATGALER